MASKSKIDGNVQTETGAFATVTRPAAEVLCFSAFFCRERGSAKAVTPLASNKVAVVVCGCAENPS